MEDIVTSKRDLANQTNNAQDYISYEIRQLAQHFPESKIFNYNSNTKKQCLRGPIDLQELSRLHVNEVVITNVLNTSADAVATGGITEVKRVPESIIHFQLNRNLLTQMPEFSRNIERIELNDNYIEQLDLEKYPKLKVLRVNGNRIREIKNIPASIEEMDIGNNRLQNLDLIGLTKLRKLNCVQNDLLQILNVPASLTSLQTDDAQPELDLSFIPNSTSGSPAEKTANAKKNAEYVNALHTYFSLKQKYEESIADARRNAIGKALARNAQLTDKEKRKIADKVAINCVNCKRPFGTVFKTENNRFIAHCGNTQEPCPLHIEIFRGIYNGIDRTAKYYETQLTELKDNIIRLKMDTLFGYADEGPIVDDFKGVLEEYHVFSFLHKTLLDDREDKLFNKHKSELIKVKMNKINELKNDIDAHMQKYRESDDPKILRTAMHIYKQEYIPEVDSLSKLKYSVTEMVEKRVLKQSASSVRDVETLIGELPRVIVLNISSTAETEAEHQIVRNNPSEYTEEEEYEDMEELERERAEEAEPQREEREE